MSGRFDELHEKLSSEKIEDTKLHKFAEKLYLVNPDYDFIIMVLNGIATNGEMKMKINELLKNDKKNKLNDSDFQNELLKLEEQQEKEQSEEQNKQVCIENSDEQLSDEVVNNKPDETVIKNKGTDEISDEIINVQIKGEVEKPGAYTLNKGDNLSVLLNKALLSENADDSKVDYLLELDEGDCIEIPTKIIEVHISGAVKNPGFIKIKKGSCIEAVIIQAGNLTEDADEDSIDYSVKPYDGMFLNIRKKEKICIDISGAVDKPGCYYIYDGDRLGKVIAECGLKENADTSKINMSDRLKDGEKIVIPFIGNVYDINETGEEKDIVEKEDIVKEEKISVNTETTEEFGRTKKEDSKEFEIIVDNAGQPAKEDTLGHIIKKENYIAERNNRIIQFFKWIKIIIMNNISKLPGSFQRMLESVDDPVKLQLLTQGYQDGLSKANFTRLLKIQDKTSAEKLKNLISFYITLDTRAER